MQDLLLLALSAPLFSLTMEFLLSLIFFQVLASLVAATDPQWERVDVRGTAFEYDQSLINCQTDVKKKILRLTWHEPPSNQEDYMYALYHPSVGHLIVSVSFSCLRIIIKPPYSSRLSTMMAPTSTYTQAMLNGPIMSELFNRAKGLSISRTILVFCISSLTARQKNCYCGDGHHRAGLMSAIHPLKLIHGQVSI